MELVHRLEAKKVASEEGAGICASSLRRTCMLVHEEDFLEWGDGWDTASPDCDFQSALPGALSRGGDAAGALADRVARVSCLSASVRAHGQPEGNSPSDCRRHALFRVGRSTADFQIGHGASADASVSVEARSRSAVAWLSQRTQPLRLVAAALTRNLDSIVLVRAGKLIFKAFIGVIDCFVFSLLWFFILCCLGLWASVKMYRVHS
jgi:hypothetical protein